ncbi:MAG: hypothetical protein EHM70_12435 [Chloroflexota bacterium]|nr:MAG: hypothetical protein EHM70_12435 [Chloroflexota bacterium]
MHITLTNQAGVTINLSRVQWARILALAMAYGWEPAGTSNPDGWKGDEPWSGSYSSHQGGSVSRQDAQMMAAALEKSLPGIPDQDPPAHNEGKQDIFESMLAFGRALEVDNPSPSKLGIDSSYKAQILELIEFFRQGAFEMGN